MTRIHISTRNMSDLIFRISFILCFLPPIHRTQLKPLPNKSNSEAAELVATVLEGLLLT